MTWMNPDAYIEWFRCEHCETLVTEDEIVQVRPDVWKCRQCEIEETTDETD